MVSIDFLMHSSDSSIKESVDSSPLSVSTYIFGNDCRDPVFLERNDSTKKYTYKNYSKFVIFRKSNDKPLKETLALGLRCIDVTLAFLRVELEKVFTLNLSGKG